MTKSIAFCGGLAALCLILVNAAIAGETHVIVGTHTAAFKPIWKSGSDQSNGAQPLIVQVKKGDVLQIDINDPQMPHGFVTIDKKGTDQPAEKPELVQVCGKTNPDAVLKETDCSTPPHDFFGNIFKGTLKLEIGEKFAEDVNFWCVQHTAIMWGIIKLAP